MSPRSDSNPRDARPQADSEAEGFIDSKTRQLPPESLQRLGEAAAEAGRSTPLREPEDLPTPVKRRVTTASITPPALKETPAPFSLAPDPASEQGLNVKLRLRDWVFGWAPVAGLITGAAIAAVAGWFLLRTAPSEDLPSTSPKAKQETSQ